MVEFHEKPRDGMALVSGGFFVFERRFLDYLDGDPHLFFELEPLQRLAREGAAPHLRARRRLVLDGHLPRLPAAQPDLERGRSALEDLEVTSAPPGQRSPAPPTPGDRLPGADVCRFCGAPLGLALLDLGDLPLANSFLEPAELERPEPRYPLKPMVCERCWLVQIPELERAETIFSDYAYFASYSDSWLAHCERYTPRRDRALRAGSAEPRDRGRLQRRVPAPVLRARRRAGARHRAGGERRRGGGEQGDSDSARVLRRSAGARARGQWARRRPLRRQQRPRARART